MADQRFDQVKSLGILSVSLGICRALASRPEVHRLTVLSNPALPRVPDASDRVIYTDCVGLQAGKLWRVWWDQFAAYRAARRSGNEWLLLPKGFASFFGKCPVKLVSYIHDVGPEYYRRRYPRGYPMMEISYFHAGLRAAVARSDVILVNSLSTRDEVQKLAEQYGLRRPRVALAGIGFDPPPAPASAPRTRIVTLANRWPHKRTDLAVDFLARWQAARNFEGGVDWVGQLPEGVTFPAAANWRLHGRLQPEDFNGLMAEARVFVYVSDYEGFGMPPVEATLAGACPVYSDLPSTREVMQGVGCRFSNTDYDSFAAALDRALLVPPTEVKSWGTELVSRHNWQLVGERIVRALQGEGLGT